MMPDILPHVLKSLDKDPRSFQDAQPFPHIIIENFLPEEVLQPMIESYPRPDSTLWNDRIDELYQRKLGGDDIDHAPEMIRSVLYQLNSASVLKAVEKLTGEGPLISDMYYKGAGMHQIEPGGMLAVHADFSQPPHYDLFRRLNLIVYLNKDWDESYEGRLEFYSKDGKTKVKEILPVLNRAVIFNTDTDSFHGHPIPLKCPQGVTRKSIALYYYTVEPGQRGHTRQITRWRIGASNGQNDLRQQTANFLWRFSYKFADIAMRLEKARTPTQPKI